MESVNVNVLSPFWWIFLLNVSVNSRKLEWKLAHILAMKYFNPPIILKLPRYYIIFQQKVERGTGKIITLKDIANIKQRSKSKHNKNDVNNVLEFLRKQHGSKTNVAKKTAKKRSFRRKENNLEERIHYVCNKCNDEDGEDWVECDWCNQWYHQNCRPSCSRCHWHFTIA